MNDLLRGAIHENSKKIKIKYVPNASSVQQGYNKKKYYNVKRFSLTVQAKKCSLVVFNDITDHFIHDKY